MTAVGAGPPGGTTAGPGPARVLLTGGTGSIGLAVTERLVADGLEVVVYAPTPPPPGFHLDGVFVGGDVLDERRVREVLEHHEVDVVVHGAAVTPDPAAERSSARQVLEVNCLGALSVLEAAHRAGVRRYVYLGSIAAYGASATTEPVLVEEVTPDRPGNLYEISKSTAERAVLRLGGLLGTEVTALRIGDVFGPWEHPTGDRPRMSALHQATALALAGRPARLPRPGRKPWTYAIDVAHATSLLVRAPSLTHRVYNLASPHVWSVEDWCELLASRVAGFSYGVVPEDPNVTLFADNAPMSPDRLLRQFDWLPGYGLAAAFADYLAWIEEHGRWGFGESPRSLP